MSAIPAEGWSIAVKGDEQLSMAPDNMKVAWLKGRMQIEVGNLPIPDTKPSGMRVKVRSCGVCGSDINRMRNTTSRQPRVLGHEIAGDVIAVSDPNAKFQPGDRVAVGHVHVPCMHCVYCQHRAYSMCRQFKSSSITPGGYSEYVDIPLDQMLHTVLKIPDSVSYDDATFVDPIACCLKALRRCGVRPLDRVLVVGAGIMGLLFAHLLKLMQADSIFLDISTVRLDRARECGAHHVLNPENPDVVKEVLSLTGGNGVDFALTTFTNRQIIAQVTTCVRDGGTLCIFAPPAFEETVNIDPGNLFYREQSIISSYSSDSEDLEPAMRWIESGRIDIRSLITAHTDLEGIAAAVFGLKENGYKIIVHP